MTLTNVPVAERKLPHLKIGNLDIGFPVVSGGAERLQRLADANASSGIWG